MGISWRDVLGEGEITPEIRQRLSDEKRLKVLETRHGAFILGKAMYPEFRSYFSAAETNIEKEIESLKDKMDPTRIRRRKMQAAIERYGMEALWEKFLQTPKGQSLNALYSLECERSMTPIEPVTPSAEGLLSW